MLKPELHQPPPTPKPGVLIVEDEPAVREMLGFALGHFGFAVRVAGTGEQAVRLYQEHRGGIDIVLLDVLLRGGGDGPETLDALRRLNPALPAVFMTGYAGRYSAEDLLARGAACVFQKPFAIEDVACTLWRLVGPGPSGQT